MLFSCITYVLLILLIRSAGKRVISKKNVSDFVITVAVGSAAATLVLTREVRLVEGQPRLLLYRGSMIRDALLEEEVNESEVLQAIRNRGIAAIEDVFAVVLEAAGASALAGVSGAPRDTRE